MRVGVGARCYISRAENLRGQFGAKGFQQLQFSRRRQSRRCKLGIRKNAAGSLEHAVAVASLKVVAQFQRLAHADVTEQRSAQIEPVGLQTLAGAQRYHTIDDAAFVPELAAVAAHPDRYRIDLHQVEFARLEGFGGHVFILVKPIHNAVEVELPAAYRQVPGPVVGIALELDAPPGVDGVDGVGAAGDRILAHDGVERLMATVGL